MQKSAVNRRGAILAVVVAGFAMGASPAFADEPKARPERPGGETPMPLKIHFRDLREPKGGKSMVVEVVNVSDKPIVLATVVTTEIIEKTKGRGPVTLRLRVPEPERVEGRVVVLSETELGVVKLLPNDVARLRFNTSSPRLLPVEPYFFAKGVKAVVITTYECPDVWSKRYGVWSGEVRTECMVEGKGVSIDDINISP